MYAYDFDHEFIFVCLFANWCKFDQSADKKGFQNIQNNKLSIVANFIRTDLKFAQMQIKS